MNKKIRATKENFEDWHAPDEYDADGELIVHTKFQKPPKQYEQGFLQKLDGRTEAFQILTASYNAILEDMGGSEGLSHIQLCLAERFCFLEFFLKSLEARIASKPKKSSKLIARWIAGLNALSGLAAKCGLERRAKRIDSLSSYVKSKK